MLIALTGGIGSGKSTVATQWVELGATEIDADQLAREVVQPGSKGLSQVLDAFGHDLLQADGHLNRAELAKRAFASDENRKRLEGILHPLIQELAKEKTAAIDGIVVYTIPLLVESNPKLNFDKVVTISCPAEVRIERLINRGLSRHEALQRIAAQATDAQREARANVVIDSNCTLEELKTRARETYVELING